MMTNSVLKSCVLGFLLLTVWGMLPAHGQNQPPAFALSMTASCPGYGDQILQFLTVDGASAGMDFYDNPGALPPGMVDPSNLPIGGFYSYIHPATSDLDDDFKLTDARPLAYDVSWTFSIQIPAGKTGELSWDTENLYDGWKVTLAGTVTHDMRLVQDLSFSASGVYTYTLTAAMIGIPVSKAGEFRQIRPGWNLLSPVLPSTRGDDDVVLEDGTRAGDAPYRVYGLLHGTLQQTTSYVIGRAYWVYHSGLAAVDVWPVTVSEYEGREWVREPGWNFVGVQIAESLAEETAWTWNNAVDGGRSAFRKISNGTENLAVGVGYWVHKPVAP